MWFANLVVTIFVSQITFVCANTEKAIFLAPALSDLPTYKPAVDYLRIRSIPSDGIANAALSVAFPNDDQTTGIDHWYILRDLKPRQRYELRVCWSSTQPTTFNIDVYTISNVFDSPDLINSLAKAIDAPSSRRSHSDRIDGEKKEVSQESFLFLRIQAAADFYSPNKTLMQSPPPVNVDLILDLYLGNILPKSLIPTIGYLIILGVLGTLVSSKVSSYIAPQRSNFHESTQDSASLPLVDGVESPQRNTGSNHAESSRSAQTRRRGHRRYADPAARRHPFQSLPHELILNIIDFLTPDQFINFAFAEYTLLQANGMAPDLSPERIRYLTRDTNMSNLLPLLRLPPEIILQILRHLRPIDIMRFVLANYQQLALQGIAPPIIRSTMAELQAAIAESRRASPRAIVDHEPGDDFASSEHTDDQIPADDPALSEENHISTHNLASTQIVDDRAPTDSAPDQTTNQPVAVETTRLPQSRARRFIRDDEDIETTIWQSYAC